MLGNSVKGLDCQNRAKVFKTAAMPVLTYGAPLYWRQRGVRVLSLLTRMKKVQNYAARWTINAFKTTPGGGSCILAGFAPLAAELDKLIDKAYRRWQSLPPGHGVSIVMNKPRMAFLDTHRTPTILVRTPRGHRPVSPKAKSSKVNHAHPSPLVRAKIEDWTSDFPVNWDCFMRNELPAGVTLRKRDWHEPIEDVGRFIEEETKDKDVYIVLAAIDQRLSKNPRGHGILAKLGKDNEAALFHFPLPFRLHFEATVHAITNSIEIITQNSIRPAVLYTVHHFAPRHALIPYCSEYGRDAEATARFLATWPRNLECAWLPAATDWPVLTYLKKQLKPLRTEQEFFKTAPYFRSLIRKRFEARWAEEHEKIDKGSQWLKVRFGHCFASVE
jgi:hypothetical protein